jgi:flagellar basal-body rod modification protein FlgD
MTIPTNVLGKDDFLKLLLTQMKYQDPTSPMDTDQMVQQEAQMTQLEQSMNMNENIEELVKITNSNNSGNAITYLGREVNIPVPDSITGEYYTGIVDEVRFRNGSPVLVVDGNEIAMTDVASVKIPEITN